jgi:hypothetical protein
MRCKTGVGRRAGFVEPGPPREERSLALFSCRLPSISTSRAAGHARSARSDAQATVRAGCRCRVARLGLGLREPFRIVLDRIVQRLAVRASTQKVGYLMSNNCRRPCGQRHLIPIGVKAVDFAAIRYRTNGTNAPTRIANPPGNSIAIVIHAMRCGAGTLRGWRPGNEGKSPQYASLAPLQATPLPTH